MSSVFTATTIPLETSTVQFSLARMEGGIRSLSDFLDELEKSTMRNGIPGGDGTGVDAKLEKIRGDLKAQNEEFANGLKEVELVFKDMMETGMIRDIQKEVEAQVEEEVDRIVEEQFTKYLKELLPDALKKELAETKARLDASRVELHNSESIEANALLRVPERGDGLNRQMIHKLQRSDGTVSSLFPKTLQDAFDLDKETCKTLLEDYGLEVSHNARSESLLNSFLKLCGIQYQFVRQVNSEDVQPKVQQVMTSQHSNK